MKRKHLSWIILAAIIFLSFLIRTYNLAENPPGFFADEASIGYNAFRILNTGKDEHGKTFPIFFEAFGEYKNPLQTYLTVPSIFIFGPDVFAVRFSSAVLSLLTILSIFFLARELNRHMPLNEMAGLSAAFFLAISPWHIHFSRVSLEGFMPFIFCVTLGTYFFIRFPQNKKYLFFASSLFAIGMYSYFPARIFIPCFTALMSLIFIKEVRKNLSAYALSGALALVILLPLLFSVLTGSGTMRWRQVSIFDNPPSEKSILTHVTENYASHFSESFLFTKGDIDMPGQFVTRHSVRGFGQLYLAQLPFIFLGIFWFFKKKQRKYLAVLLGWIILYPLGSMFTTDDSAQATRSFVGVVPFQILAATGFASSVYVIKKHHRILAGLFVATVLLLFSLSTYSYLRSYFESYKLYAADFWGWQYGAREIVEIMVKEKSNYDMIYLAPAFNSPEIFIKFFGKDNCTNCTVGLPGTDLKRDMRQLFSLTPEYLARFDGYKLNKKYTILYPDGNIAFIIAEIVE